MPDSGCTCEGSYTFIDDVQLIEYCDFACNADTGEPQLKVEANHIGEDAGFVQVDWTTENNSPTSPWHNKLIATWDPTEGTSSLNSNVDAPLLGIIANFQPIIFYLENANYAYLVVREWGDANVYSDFGGLYYQELPYNACGYKATPDCPLGAPLYFNGFGNNGNPIISSGGNYYWQLYYGNCHGDYVTGGNLWQGEYSGCYYNQIDPDSGADCIDELPTTWDYYQNYDFTPCTLITASNTQITSSTGAFVICEGQPYVYPNIVTTGEGSFTANWYHNGVLVHTTDQNTPQGSYSLSEVGTYTIEIFTDVFCTNPIIKTVTVTECLGGENTSIVSSKEWMAPYNNKVYLCEGVCTNLSIQTTSSEPYTAYWYKNDVLFYTNTESGAATQTICEAGTYAIKIYASQYTTEPLIKTVTVVSQTYDFEAGYTVNSNNNTTFQNTTKTLKGVLRITNNSTLLIKDAMLKMSPNAHIVVERGSKLIVNNATITSFPPYNCMTGTWLGIEVWGNTDVTHQSVFETDTPDDLTVDDYENLVLDTEDPGMVILKNNALIENGNINTIITNRSDGYFPTYYGGIVYAQNSTFSNCRKAVAFMKYNHRNFSQFKNCTFTSNNYTKAFEGISIWDCNGILVDGCTFNFDGVSTYQLNGITAGEGLTVNNCQFTNLKKALNLGASSYTIGSALVTNNTFNNNEVAITDMGMHYLHAEGNQINNGVYGIIVAGNSGYDIKSNTFIGQTAASTFTAFTSQNTTGDNNIACNIFDNTTRGVFAYDNNRGLQFYDNTFTTTNSDLTLSGNNSRLNYFQGTLTDDGTILPFFNLFTLNRPTHRIKTFGNNNAFAYFYHTDATYTPEANNRLVPHCYAGDTYEDCTTWYNYMGIGVGYPYELTNPTCLDLNGDGDPGLLPPSIDDCQTKECYYAMKTYLLSLENTKDGGDKQELLNDLYNSPEALATYQKYMAASPYLTDDVLKEVTQSTTLSPSRRTNILIANSPLSDEMMNLAYQNVSPSVYQLLYTLKYYLKISERDRLDMRIGDYADKKENLLRQLLNKFTDQKDYVQLDDLLNTENSTFALRTLVASKAARGDYSTAQSILDNLPTDTPDEQDYQTIQQINLQLSIATQNQTPFSLSTEQNEALQNIALAYGTQAPYAQTLLGILTGQTFDWQLPDLTENEKTTRIPYPQVPLADLKALNTLVVQPNPAQQSAQITLPPFAVEQNAQLQVFDVTGKLVQSISLNNSSTLTTLDVKDLANGLYIVSLSADGVRLAQAKMVVQH